MYKDINGFYLQWHITKNCNCRCTHCYMPDTPIPEDMNLQQLLRIFLQFKDFIKYFYNNHIQGTPVKPQITITGGEPFVYKDFMRFLEILSTNKDFFYFIILTNGTLITDKIANKIKEYGIEHVQVSIEGPENIHDSIRGKGTFKKAIRGIEHLVNAGIRTHISFTAHKYNYKFFPDVVEIGKKLGVQRVWTDRVIPFNKNEQIISLLPSETKEYVEMINELRKINLEQGSNIVSNVRALQKIGTKVHNEPYYCHAGVDIFTLMENGDVLACRRMPIFLGNILKTSFKDIYLNNEIVKDLRSSLYTPPEACKECDIAEKCTGGLKCLSYAIHKDYKIADPGCWLKK